MTDMKPEDFTPEELDRELDKLYPRGGVSTESPDPNKYTEEQGEIYLHGFGDGMEDGHSQANDFRDEILNRPGMEKVKEAYWAEVHRIKFELYKDGMEET